jgi:FAD-dependent urate hydroxylase
VTGETPTADAAAQNSLRLLGPEPTSWVRQVPGTDHDVTVVGGGQSGVTITYALRRAGIAAVTVLDAADDETTAGGWLTQARMRVLRTPKTYHGPELGNPALGFRAWYEGLYGAAAYDKIDRVVRTDWAAYLAWLRRQVGVSVRYGTRLAGIEPAKAGLRLRLRAGDREVTETTRKVVLATGAEGTGGYDVPAIFESLPVRRWAHTGQAIDFAALRYRSVGVLGAASSAFDAAATALEAGAAAVHLFSRRPDLVITPPGGTTISPGGVEHFHELPDPVRWERRWAYLTGGASVPLDSVLRAIAFPSFRIHLEAPWLALHEDGDRVRVEAGDGTHHYDFVIAGTGYQQDPRTRPELASLAHDIALWRDVYEPPAELASERLGSYPYLGSGYQFIERQPGAAPWLRDIHVFNFGASSSFGLPVGDLLSLNGGVPRLVSAIARDLFLADVRSGRPPGTSEPAPASYADRYEHAVWRPDKGLTDVTSGIGTG